MRLQYVMKKLNFYISINFDPDAVFGTNVASALNDDWLNVYANFDWKTGRMDSALAVYLVCTDGHEFEFSYPLTPAEQVQLWDKMDAYCRQQNGQRLEEMQGPPCCGSRQRTPRDPDVSEGLQRILFSLHSVTSNFVGADEWIYFKQCGNVFAANHQPATKRKGVHTMKTQKRQVTITDLYNLVAHETVSLLEAVDDNAIPLALEMRED